MKRLEGYQHTREDLCRALGEADVPEECWEAFVEFHMRYGGLSEKLLLNEMVWGILHAKPKWLNAGCVEAMEDDEVPGVWHVICADSHPSDIWTIDQYRRLYWCYHLKFSDYEEYFKSALESGCS